jgi:hypothetical protein
VATYKNAYTLLEEVRDGLNEYSTAYVQGTDTTGIFRNAHLLNCIDRAQSLLHALLVKHVPNNFLTSAEITGVDSVYDLPWNFGTVREFKDENGYKVYRSGIDALPVNSGVGSDRFYYRSGQTFVLNKSGVTETYTLWYYTKPREIHLGQGGANCAATVFHLGSDAKNIDDYYNGMTIENITQGTVETISDYTGSTALATVTGTPVTDDWYGIVSEIPEAFHHLIAPRAIMIAKAEHPVSPKAPTTAEASMWKDEVSEALTSYGIGHDVTPEDIWCDFGVGSGVGVSIPGHGSTIWD